MSPEKYGALYAALSALDVTLINSPEQYRHCHYFPESYSSIESLTPKSVWLSAKEHDIEEACFIPSARDRDVVSRVVTRFLELQDNDPAGGLVFREFIEFANLSLLGFLLGGSCSPNRAVALATTRLGSTSGAVCEPLFVTLSGTDS